MAKAAKNEDADKLKDPLARKLTKITFKNGEWNIQWAQGTQSGSIKSNEPAKPDLIHALENLRDEACDETPWLASDFREKVFVLGVTMDWKGDNERRNAFVILGIKGKPRKVESDKRLADNQLDEKKKPRWSTNAVRLFDGLELAAFAYVDGERAQTVMPLFDGPKPEDNQGSFDDELQENAA